MIGGNQEANEYSFKPEAVERRAHPAPSWIPSERREWPPWRREYTSKQWSGAVLVVLVFIVPCAGSPPSSGHHYKKGDVVVVVRDSELKANARVLGKVDKGNRLTVERAEGNWLWVRSDKAAGWISTESVRPARGLKGSWKVLRTPNRGDQIVLSNMSSPIITFDGNKSGKGIFIDAGWGNTANVSRAWTYQGDTIKWSGLSGDNNFGIYVRGKWKVDWKDEDQLEVTDSDGGKMRLTRVPSKEGAVKKQIEQHEKAIESLEKKSEKMERYFETMEKDFEKRFKED